MSEQNSEVEQLWYTWSDVGLNAIRAGFRIRAASEGLQDIRSERVQHLDSYQRYFLPQEAEPAIAPALAPICLSLINTGRERILVHKAYTGKDAIGRYGVFFVHLLAGLPEDFSARDAISLWKSSFWQTSDASLTNHYDTHLDRVSLSEQVRSMPKQVPYSGQNSEKIQAYLPYVIQAYLTKKPLYEAGEKIRRLYIIAPDGEVASLISGLTQCLPKRLLKDLTFSTYEHDIFEATTEIVGTCWLSEPDAEENPLLERLFPSWYSQELLALNCYTNTWSPLENNSFLENKPLAASFAAAATHYFLHDGDEFKKFLEDAEDCPDVDSFLRLYQNLIVNSQNPDDQAIENALHPQTQADYKNTAKVLSKAGYQQGIIRLTKYKLGWWQQSGKAAIINLCQRGAIMPELMFALLSIANAAATDAVNMAREKKAPLLKDVPAEVEAFKNITDLIYCIAPPNVDQRPCMSLLQGMLSIKDISIFFNKHWDIYAYFVNIGCYLLPVSEKNSKLLAPLLTLSWGTFGAFLALRLPLGWKEIAVKTLVSSKSSVLDTETATFLGKSYARPIEEFFIATFSHTDYWATLLSLFERLTKAQYPGKMSLLFRLLNSEIGEYPDYAEQLLDTAQLTVGEQVQFLIPYGQRYLPLFNRMSLVILETMSKLSKSDASAKMHVLSNWLGSPPLQSTWFSPSPSGENNLSTILRRAELNSYESGAVLQEYGQVYIRRYPQSPTLLGLFESYATIFERHATTVEDRQPLQSVLGIWLPLPLEQKTLERLLVAAKLTDNEQIYFLEHYGLRYFGLFPELQILPTYTKTYSKYLWSVDIDRFESKETPERPSYLEQLLDVLRRLPRSHGNMWEVWYTIASFVREPSLLQAKARRIAEYANMLLVGYANRKQIDAHTKLLQLLARACIKNEDTLARLIEVFSAIFTPPDLMLLIYEIADYAQKSIHMQQQGKALFVPCIACAYKFKNRFLEKEEQAHFLELFLNTLLSHTDKKTRKWINGEVRRQHPEIAAQWQKYITGLQYPLFSKVVTPTPIKHFLLRLEYITAKAQLLLALRRKNITRLAKMSEEYMTTLNGIIADEWWSKIDIALRQLNTLEDVVWQQSPVVAPYLAIPTNDMIPQQSAVAANYLSVSKEMVSTVRGTVQKPFWFNRPRVPWRPIITFNERQTTTAFKEVQRALRSEHIGRIVRVATDHMIVLEAYYKSVPDTWWRMLDAAFNFFIACEDTSTGDPLQEQAIITASEKIKLLVNAHQPAPILTEHERQRVKTAVQFIANMDVQKAKDADRQWIRETLSLAHMPGMDPTEQLYPHKASTETSGSLKYLRSWLARWLLGQRGGS